MRLAGGGCRLQSFGICASLERAPAPAALWVTRFCFARVFKPVVVRLPCYSCPGGLVDRVRYWFVWLFVGVA
eukprot:5695598-Lingulodinium_polyedra.AAC.1